MVSLKNPLSSVSISEKEREREKEEQKHRVINFRMKFALHDKKPVL